MSVVVQGVQPRGNQIWAVRAAWSGSLRPSLLLEQSRGGQILQSWIVHQLPDSHGWALLWGDGKDEELDLRTGDTFQGVEGHVGLGDAVAAFTSALGVKPCGGCKKRQEWLNQKVPRVWRRRKGCASCR